jgi:hypothetical protein
LFLHSGIAEVEDGRREHITSLLSAPTYHVGLGTLALSSYITTAVLRNILYGPLETAFFSVLASMDKPLADVLQLLPRESNTAFFIRSLKKAVKLLGYLLVLWVLEYCIYPEEMMLLRLALRISLLWRKGWSNYLFLAGFALLAVSPWAAAAGHVQTFCIAVDAVASELLDPLVARAYQLNQHCVARHRITIWAFSTCVLVVLAVPVVGPVGFLACQPAAAKLVTHTHRQAFEGLTAEAHARTPQQQ